MNYKISQDPQEPQEEGSSHLEDTEEIHSFAESQPSSTTPSQLSNTPMNQYNVHVSATDQSHHQPYVPTQNPSSLASSPLIFSVPSSTDISPGYYFSTPTFPPVPSSNTGYFASINRVIHSSVPSHPHYANPNFECSNYVPREQNPPVPLPIQRITSQQVQSGRKRRSSRTNSASASPPTPLSLSDQEQQQTLNKRQKRRHDLTGLTVCSSEITGGSVSPRSSTVTPLPSPVLYHQKEKTQTEETMAGVGQERRNIENLEHVAVKKEQIEESGRDNNEQQQSPQSQSPQSQQPSSPLQPQQIQQQQQRTVKAIETQISFLKDECATILMMLGSLRTAFLADESNKQHEVDHVKNKKMMVLKDRKIAMEREMRIAYDDLMLQVRQLERKVERLEERSKVICRRG